MIKLFVVLIITMQLKLARVVFFLMLIAIEMKFIFDETEAELNWCVYLFRHSGTYPVVTKKNPDFVSGLGAENETRTRDPDLGKVVLYQLSYFRIV